MTLYYRATFDDFEIDINIPSRKNKTKTRKELIKRELNKAVTNYLYYTLTKNLSHDEIEIMYGVDFQMQTISKIIRQVVNKYRLTNKQLYKTKIIKRLPQCEGCRLDAPDQNSHMELGGCLYLDSD